VLGGEKAERTEVGDFVNFFWPNLAHWSGMLWDPKRFPIMTYELNKEDGPSMFKLSKEDEAIRRALPWRMRLLSKLFMPKSFSKVKDMKKSRCFFGSLRKSAAAPWNTLKMSLGPMNTTLEYMNLLTVRDSKT